MSSNVVELCYSRWAGHYSHKNWGKNWPQFNDLKEQDLEFWVKFVNDIEHGFSIDNATEAKKNIQ